MTTGTADKFIGGELYSLIPISIMSAPNGSYLRTIKTNEYVGTIFSFVLNNGNVWWQLDDKQGYHIGYVQHETGKFDTQKLENSLIEKERKRQEEIEKAVNERKKNNSMFSFIEDFEGIMKTILIAIILMTILNLVKK